MNKDNLPSTGVELPKNDSTVIELNSGSPEDVTIYTTDDINKTDGVVTIGEIINNQYSPKEAVVLAPIDIEQRKIEKQVRVNSIKKKKQKIMTTDRKRANTITSLIVLVVAGLIVGVYYYFKNRETEADFKLKDITIELGTKPSAKITDYITWKNVDEITYKLDTSKIDTSKVGDYKFSVTHVKVTKKGKAKVEDTTAPTATLKDVEFFLNDTYTAADFIESCNDLSECSYRFSDDAESKTADAIGKSAAYILVSDKYKNSTVIKAPFNVVEKDNSLTCYIDITQNDYTAVDTIEIKFDETNKMTAATRVIANSYINDKAYNDMKTAYSDLSSFTFDDTKKTVTKTELYGKSIYGLSNRDALLKYFEKESYSCN